ncbi:hypothetical protein Sjap_016876 [Stephania japonica]|uniref:Uncharacterized protein n=1 Tax=Stephania japonica TaxID=461633 RepID=A0AAP0I534_9MAGN
MESMIEDYKYVDAINIVHSGQTKVMLFRYGTVSYKRSHFLEKKFSHLTYVVQREIS